MTDLHLYDDPDGSLLGVNTQTSFKKVLNKAIFNARRPPDLIVLTGDLVHDDSEAAYRRLGGILSDTGIPCYCLPGNHDTPSTMKVLAEFPGVFLKGTADLPHWRLVLLNSRVANDEYGHLSGSELKRLKQRLDTSSNVLICMHHQPVPVGSEWIDGMMLDNSESFLNIVDNADSVKGVIWGHIHQEFESERKQVKYLASPSTCIQFTPKLKDFKVDPMPPACRMLALGPDGSIDTELMLLDMVSDSLEIGSSGY
ncbi:MAG: metallophosphoesterase [bacterium]